MAVWYSMAMSKVTLYQSNSLIECTFFDWTDTWMWERSRIQCIYIVPEHQAIVISLPMSNMLRYDFKILDKRKMKIRLMLVSSLTTIVLRLVENYAKNMQLFFHCGSFDHHALQLLNNCMVVSFYGVLTNFLEMWGFVIYHWKVLKIHFQQYITHP